MRISGLVPLLVVFLALTASGQDWQDCKPDGDYSFKEIKAAVRRVTATGMYSGWDDKTFSRSGDLVAVAILQTIDDSEITSPAGAKNVLVILRNAFACPQKCVKATDDRRPRVTLLLLEHLREITRGEMQSDIDEAKTFILEHAGKGG